MGCIRKTSPVGGPPRKGIILVTNLKILNKIYLGFCCCYKSVLESMKYISAPGDKKLFASQLNTLVFLGSIEAA